MLIHEEPAPHRVLVTVIARNREWCLPDLFESWRTLMTGPLSVDFLALINDSTDRSAAIARQYGIPVLEIALGLGPEERGSRENRMAIRIMREEARYAAVAGMYDYWLGCDSDFILKHDTLLRLWSRTVDIVSPVIPNGPTVIALNTDGRSWSAVDLPQGDYLLPVGALGGSVLMSRRAFVNTSFFWHLSWQDVELYCQQPGEDIFWSLVASASKFPLYLDLGCRIAHQQTEVARCGS